MAGRDLQDVIRERMEKCSLRKEMPTFVMKERLPCATSSVDYCMCLNSDVIVGLDVLFRLSAPATIYIVHHFQAKLPCQGKLSQQLFDPAVVLNELT